jgi:hypothetical protein
LRIRAISCPDACPRSELQRACRTLRSVHQVRVPAPNDSAGRAPLARGPSCACAYVSTWSAGMTRMVAPPWTRGSRRKRP